MKKYKLMLAILVIFALINGCSEKVKKVNSLTTTTVDKYGNEISKFVTEYDEDGNILAIESKDKKTLYTYDEGKCISVKDGMATITYQYDENNLIQSNLLKDDKQVQKTIYGYDERGNNTEITITDESGEILEKVSMSYNMDNILTEIIRSDTVKKDEIKIIHEIDDLGNISFSSTYINQELIETTKNEYENDSLKKIVTTFNDTEKTLTVYYSYDSNDRLIEEKVSEDDGLTFVSTTTYEYTLK